MNRKKIFLGLSILLFIFLPSVQASSDTLMHGIDVSEFQETINFEKVSQDGIEIVMIRASYGLNRDAYFEENAAGAEKAGLKVGFYHALTAENKEEAIQQAEYFWELIQTKKQDCRSALDYENFPNLNQEEINVIALAFLTRFEELSGTTPVLYSDAYRVETLWKEELSRYPLWIADYSITLPTDTGTWNNWAGFQYSDHGQIYGIQGNVDCDLFKSEFLLESTAVPEPNPINSIVVQQKDTLWAIAKRYETTVQCLVEKNQIKNPNLIYPGEILQVPAIRRFVYTVRRGDTLWSLSLRFNASIKAIAEQNCLDNPNLIQIGQKLLIP